MSILTYIVLLNYNSFDDTNDCIDSLLKCDQPNFKIVVVDNASFDDSLIKLRKAFPKIKYIESKTNKGFAGGCNLGINYAYDQGADYILLLNNDTVVSPDFLDALISCARSKDNCGLVGGKSYFFDKPNVFWDAGGRLDLWWANGIRRGGQEKDIGQYETEEQVQFVTGCMMLIPRDVIEQVGLLPECYFFGVEEWDYSKQVLDKGFNNWYCPEARIWHKVGGAHSDIDPVYYYNFMRNRIQFMQRHARGWWRPFWQLIFYTYSRFVKLIRYRNVFTNIDDIRTATVQAFEDQTNDRPVLKEDLDNLRLAIKNKKDEAKA